MAKSRCHLLMKVNHVIVANFNVANMTFNAIRENKILAKISEFTVVSTLSVHVDHLFVTPSCGHVAAQRTADPKKTAKTEEIRSNMFMTTTISANLAALSHSVCSL